MPARRYIDEGFIELIWPRVAEEGWRGLEDALKENQPPHTDPRVADAVQLAARGYMRQGVPFPERPQDLYEMLNRPVEAALALEEADVSEPDEE